MESNHRPAACKAAALPLSYARETKQCGGHTITKCAGQYNSGMMAAGASGCCIMYGGGVCCGHMRYLILYRFFTAGRNRKISAALMGSCTSVSMNVTLAGIFGSSPVLS
jgi:hypothetical protein